MTDKPIIDEEAMVNNSIRTIQFICKNHQVDLFDISQNIRNLLVDIYTAGATDAIRLAREIENKEVK